VIYALEADLGGAQPAIVVGTEPAHSSSDND
jgi:hypothetical protein